VVPLTKILEFQSRLWGDTVTHTVCEHLMDVAKLATKHNIEIFDNCESGDIWKCPACNCSCDMELLMYRLKGGIIPL